MMRNEERTDETPPYSRLFVVCSRQVTADDLESRFQKFGTIEKLHIPKDRITGESKGIAYVKYSKTSSAAAAIEELNMTVVGDKPIKVMVSSNKSDDNTVKDEKYRRLFIKVNKEASEQEITDHFSQFGQLNKVFLQKDKTTNENKGFAYVLYNTFKEAATAIEECDKKYKAIFATPKDELKRSRNSYDQYESSHSNNMYNNHWKDNFIPDTSPANETYNKDSFLPLMKAKVPYNTVNVVCTPCLPQKYIEKLFSIVPGMTQCRYSNDPYKSFSKATITYETTAAAGHAVETLNNFTYPSGEIITVKPSDPLSAVANNLTEMVNSFKNAADKPNLIQLASAIEQASSIIKAATSGSMSSDTKLDNASSSFCSVILPPPQPLADKDSKVAQRCFVVFKPGPPPLHALRDVFSRFGDLIDVAIYPRKTFGFVKYASQRAAQDAISTLHGAYVCDVKLKVMEATEKDNGDHNIEVKRSKMEE